MTPIYKNFTEWRVPFRFKVNLNARKKMTIDEIKQKYNLAEMSQFAIFVPLDIMK